MYIYTHNTSCAKGAVMTNITLLHDIPYPVWLNTKYIFAMKIGIVGPKVNRADNKQDTSISFLHKKYDSTISEPKS